MSKDTTPKRQSKFQPERVSAYLDQQGWDYRLEGENYKIQTCIFCSNTSYNFEVHKDRGYFKTWCCGEGGSFYTLRKQLGDVAFDVQQFEPEEPKATPESRDQLTRDALKFHEKIWRRPSCLEYIRGRGFTDATIKQFKLGAQKQNGQFWLTIPHFVGAESVNIKYRLLPPGKKIWRQEEDAQKVLFNTNALEGVEEIILTEGELKTVALCQMGFANAIGMTGGVQNFKPAWVDQLERFQKIYLCLDADDAGQKGARELGQRLGLDRCYNIVLPDAKDPDEYFFEKGHTADDFRALMAKAKKMDVQNVMSVTTALAQLATEIEMEETDNYKGLMTPWPEVNTIMRGLHPGDLIVLSAPPGIGKTTFALNIARYQAVECGNPAFVFCLEMNARRLAGKMVGMTLGRAELDLDTVIETRYVLKGKPLYFIDKVRTDDPEKVFDTIRACYRRYGIKLIVFDNLHFLCRNEDKLREQIGVVTQGFKLLAEELGIPVILIVHPRKLKKKGPMTYDDLRDSSAIPADADQVIVMHRDRVSTNDDELTQDGEDGSGQIYQPETQIIVDKARFGPGGRTKLWFDGALSRFRAIENIEER